MGRAREEVARPVIQVADHGGFREGSDGEKEVDSRVFLGGRTDKVMG